MECSIKGRTFRFVENPIKNNADRASYFQLAQRVFELDFSPWYESGYCGDNFTPYTLYDGDIAAASVGIAVSDFKWQNNLMSSAQVSTVMTAPEYQGMGLSRWLMELALKEWKDKCDLMYLYANDSVLDYYPRFGFEKTSEYTCSLPISRRPGKCRNMDLSDPCDLALLKEKYLTFNNPFSALTMENNFSHLMFHCATLLPDCIYHVEPFDAVVIAEHEGNRILCYDIYTDAKCSMTDILNVLAGENTTSCTLGFTPGNGSTGHFRCEKSAEHDTTMFVSEGKENIFRPYSSHKVTLPFLSRA